MGALLAAVTRFESFQFTPEELQTLHTLWQNTGLMVTPMLQAAIGTTAMVGQKAVLYGMHRRKQQEEAEAAEEAETPPAPPSPSATRIPVGVEN
jgi:hypothetical protein